MLLHWVPATRCTPPLSLGKDCCLPRQLLIPTLAKLQILYGGNIEASRSLHGLPKLRDDGGRLSCFPLVEGGPHCRTPYHHFPGDTLLGISHQKQPPDVIKMAA